MLAAALTPGGLAHAAEGDGQELVEQVLSAGPWRMWLVTPFRPNVLGQCKDIHRNPMFEGLSDKVEPRLVERRRLNLPLTINVQGRGFTMTTDAGGVVPGQDVSGKAGSAPDDSVKSPGSPQELPVYQSRLIPAFGTCFVIELDGQMRYSGAVVLAGGIHNLPFPSLLLDPFSPAGAPQFMWVERYFQPARQR